METAFTADSLKRYSLEVYVEEQPARLMLKVDSDEPFTPMNRGDRILPMDAPGVGRDDLFEITTIEHLLWTAQHKVRYVTRVYARPMRREG